MLEVLTKIRDLLEKHDYPGQASVISNLIALRDSNDPDLPRQLNSGAMWGGAGSVWEVGDLGKDTREFRNSIIALAEEMDRADFGSKDSAFIAEVFRNWNATDR